MVDLVGIDLSCAALTRARRKPAGRASGTALMLMDAQLLGFPDATFDRLLCYHVLDFTAEASHAVGEFLRVLKPGGRFVISFPSGSEDASFGMGLLSHSLKRPEAHSGRRTGGLGRTLLAGLIYLPLTLRRHPRTYTSDEIDTLLRSRGAAEVVIESDPVYRDHIASGVKKGG